MPLLPLGAFLTAMSAYFSSNVAVAAESGNVTDIISFDAFQKLGFGGLTLVLLWGFWKGELMTRDACQERIDTLKGQMDSNVAAHTAALAAMQRHIDQRDAEADRMAKLIEPMIAERLSTKHDRRESDHQ